MDDEWVEACNLMITSTKQQPILGVTLILILFAGSIPISFADQPKIASPYKQLESGISYDEIQCKDSYDLIIRPNYMPSCVRSETAEKLAQRLGFVIKIDSAAPKDQQNVVASYVGAGVPYGITDITISPIPKLGETADVRFYGEVWEYGPSETGGEPIFEKYLDSDFGYLFTVGTGFEVLDEQATIVRFGDDSDSCVYGCSHGYELPANAAKGDDKIMDFTIKVKAIKTGVWDILWGDGGWTEGNQILTVTVGETRSYLGSTEHRIAPIGMSVIVTDDEGNPVYHDFDAEIVSLLPQQEIRQHFFAPKSDSEMQQLNERLLQMPYFQELLANFTG